MDTLERVTAKLLLHEYLPRLKRRGIALKDSPVSPERFALGVAAVYCGAWDTRHFRMKLDEAFHALDRC